jgi:beta-lactamase class C
LTIRPFRILALACVALAPLALAALDCRAADVADAADVRVSASVDRAIRPLMAQYGVPGMAVAITVDGRTRFFNYGLASRASKAPVDEGTLFELGSVSKTFTATLACLARERGALSLNDHPSRYLPALAGSALERATLLDFGAYTAGGLPQQVPDGIADDTQMLAWLRAFQPEAAPGAVRKYSNVSLGVFGRAAALALHTDFADAMQQQVFPALDLQHTYIHVPSAAMADYAWGEARDGTPARVRPDVFDVETYGVKSSAADMIRFVQANIDASGLAAPMQGALACTHIGYFTVAPIVQGLGWEQLRGPLTLQRLLDANSDRMAGESNPAARLPSAQQAPPAGTLFNKTGSTRGFGSYVLFVPSRRIGIVMLANKNVPNAARVEAAYAILQALVPVGQTEAGQR